MVALGHWKKIALPVLTAGLPVAAQVNELDPGANMHGDVSPWRIHPEGLGDPVAGPFNVEVQGEVGQLGVDHAFGHYWVTSRHLVNPNHAIWKFTEDGTFVKAFEQSAASASSSWGYRDGASDEGANQLYFGFDGGNFAIHDYDPATGDITENCVQVTKVPGTIRALARTPDGTFVTKSFASEVYEFDAEGNLLSTWPDPGFSAYGCAYDADADSYWWSVDLSLVTETNASMATTGRSWDASVMFPASAAQGGLDLYEDARSPTGAAFVILSQGQPDQLGVYEAEAGSAANNGNSTGPVTCGPTPPPPPLSDCFLETIFASNNQGEIGGAVYMDVAVGPEDLEILGLEVNTSLTGMTPFRIEMWTRPGTYIGGECDQSQWTRLATGDGKGEGIDKMSRVVFATPPTLSANESFGIALVAIDADHWYADGTGANQAYSDEFMSLELGAATNRPFDCLPFSPRVWNGRYYYEPAPGCNPCPECSCQFDTSTGPNICDIFDFLAFQDGFVAGDDCAIDLDTSTGVAVGDIFDFLAFQSGFVAGCP